jgi:hydroxymethylbilane synthase
LDHPRTRAAVTAERAFVGAVGGGCRVPLAAYADVGSRSGADRRLLLSGLVMSEDGLRRFQAQEAGPLEEPAAVASALVQRLLGMGAGQLLSETRV